MDRRTLKDIEDLVSSRDAQKRIAALVKIENHCEDLGPKKFEELIERLLRDTDRRVQEQAKRVQALVDAESDERFGLAGTYTVFQDLPEELEDEPIGMKSEELDKIRAAAFDLIAQPVLKLHATLMTDTSGPTDTMVEALGNLRLPQSLPILSKVATDWVYQPKVVEALAEYRTREAEETLLGIAQNPQSPAGSKALAQMGFVDAEWAFSVLEPFTADPDPSRRQGAAKALGNLKHEGADTVLEKLLGDSDEGVVVAAVGSLARRRTESAATRLRKLALGSDSAKIRSAIAAAFKRIQSTEGKDTLMKLLVDADSRTRANALESLSFYELAPEEANGLLVPLLRDETPRIRGNAIVAIYRYRPSQAVENLSRLFGQGDKMMRRAAAWCASQIQAPEVIQSLITMVLTEQDTEVLTSAMKHLSRLGRRDAVDVITRMTRHPREEVRVTSMRILGRIGNSGQLAVLGGLLKQESSPKVRSAIVSAIAKLAGSNALSLLPRYLNDKDDRVVANTVLGLYQSGNLEAIAHLKPLLMHPGPRVQANAVVALFSLGELSAVPDLNRLLESSDPKLVTSGAWALGSIGRELRIKSVGSRILMKMALKDYHRKVVAQDSQSQTMARFQGYDLTTGARFELPSGIHGSQVLMEGLIAPGLESSAGPEEDPGVDVASDERLAELLEKSQVVASPLAGDRTAPRDSAGPAKTTNLEEQGLAWEGILKIARSGAEDALEWVDDFLEESPDDEMVQLLKLNLLLERAPESVVDFIETEVLSKSGTYLELLYLAARELKSGEAFEKSLKLYLRIFRIQHDRLNALIRFGEDSLTEDPTGRPSEIIKFLSSRQGLTPGLEGDLGSFYLSEQRYDEAIPLLYRARFAHPDNAKLTLKLAFACKERSHPQLAKKLIKRVVAREPKESPEYRRALKIYKSIKKVEG